MKSRIIFTFVLICALSPQTALAADRLMCTTASGQIFARKKCASGESALTLSQLLSIGKSSVKPPVGPVGAAGLTGLDGEKGQTGRTGPAGLPNFLAGPRGHIDYSACHRVVSGPAEMSGQVTLTATCDSVNEFLLTDEWSISGTGAFIHSISHSTVIGSNNERLPYNIAVTTAVTNGSDYMLVVKAFCCPR